MTPRLLTAKLFATLIVALAFAAPQAHARIPVPIVNYADVAVTGASPGTLDSERVKQAIMAGAAAKGWIVAAQPDGKLLATLHVRGKHTVMVLIDYGPGKYSLNYKDSVNMNYDPRDGQPVIHPFYANWVHNLMEAIRAAALKL